MVSFSIEDSRLLKYTQEFEESYTGDDLEVILTEQSSIPLRVVRSGGFDVTPNYNIIVTDLNRGTDGILYKKFYNKGFGGIKFKIRVLLKPNDVWESQFYQAYTKSSDNVFNVIDVLNGIIMTMTPVKVVTDAIDIPNGNYIITKNSNKKQTNDNHTIWELEFTTYVPLVEIKYNNDNTIVNNAVSAAKKSKAKVAAKKKNSKSKSTVKSAMGKCTRKGLVYSKKKKVVDCVKTMQKILKQESCYTGVLDGWYGKLTVEAVKKFQKKYKLKQTGKVDSTTFNYLCNRKHLNPVLTTFKKALKKVK